MINRKGLAALSVIMLAAGCSGPAARPPSTPEAPPAPAPTASLPVQPAAKAADESLTIDFATADSSLSTTANQQLDGAARLYRDAKPEVMIVYGHSDKVGAEYSNLILSAVRADTVKRALVARGIPAERLQIVAVGAAEPTPTVRADRTAVVTWR